MEQIFDVLDLDYEEYKDKLPKPDDGGLGVAQNAIISVVPEDDPADPVGGGVIE